MLHEQGIARLRQGYGEARGPKDFEMKRQDRVEADRCGIARHHAEVL